MNDDETDTWVALEAATRNVVVLIRLRIESCGPGLIPAGLLSIPESNGSTVRTFRPPCLLSACPSTPPQELEY
jgi:hypothetical protein